MYITAEDLKQRLYNINDVSHSRPSFLEVLLKHCVQSATSNIVWTLSTAMKSVDRHITVQPHRLDFTTSEQKFTRSDAS
jgi:hypothetical protein